MWSVRRAWSGAIVAMAVVTAVVLPGLIALHFKGPLIYVLPCAAFAAGYVADPFKKGIGDWLVTPFRESSDLRDLTQMHDRHDQIQRVRDCPDPRVWRVHPSASVNGAEESAAFPPYVKRDLHGELAEAVQAGGLVVIQGPSAAGKTRLAFEVIQEVLPDWWLIVPEAPESLRKIAKIQGLRQAVVWLDDVERYLSPGALTERELNALCAAHRKDVLVVATLRSEALSALKESRGSETSVGLVTMTPIWRDRRRYLLSKNLSDQEEEKARKLSGGDDRIAAALEQDREIGFAAYLAAGPAVRDRWESAVNGEQRTAGAIITAAVDARRAGYLSSLPEGLLKELHVHYLPDDLEQRRSGADGFAVALKWASEAAVRGASGCLNLAAEEDCYEPFDYLVDDAQRANERPLGNLPPQVWEVLLARASLGDASSIGVMAEGAGLTSISEKAFRRGAERGVVTDMFNLANLLKGARKENEAEEWYRKAASRGDTGALLNLGILLKDQGRTSEAENEFREGAGKGDPAAMSNLGLLLKDLGRLDEAKRWHRESVRVGDLAAMVNLALMLRDENDEAAAEEAERLLRRAAEAGSAAAMFNLGVIFHTRKDLDEAESWYRQAIGEERDLCAVSNLGLLIHDRGDDERAAEFLRPAADEGFESAVINRGVLLGHSDQDFSFISGLCVVTVRATQAAAQRIDPGRDEAGSRGFEGG